LESPYKGNVARNIRYAQFAAREMMFRYGEAAFASHLFYTQFMDDEIPTERQLGVRSSIVWARAVRSIAVYADFGITDGMRAAIESARDSQHVIQFRNLYEPWMQLV
jgi:hypothetical protein